MTVRSGSGWITIKRGQIVESAETAIECKTRLVVKRKQERKHQQVNRSDARVEFLRGEQ